MPTIRRKAELDDAELREVLSARRGIIGEDHAGAGSFRAATGPVHSYRRDVTWSRLGSGRLAVEQTVSYRLGVPLTSWLLAPWVRMRVGRMGGDATAPWWGPPDQMGPEAWAVLSSLAVMAAAIGYLSTLLTQTITYSAAEFGAGPAAQGTALAAVRADIVISIVLVAASDRRGRRAIVLGGGAAGCVLTAAGAFAPTLAWLAASQILARGFVTASSIAGTVLVAESMPKGARAWAVGIIALATALGAGVCVVALPVAGLGLRSWRLLYLGALAWLGVVALARPHLHESRRYLEQTRHRAKRPLARIRELWGRRLLLLAASFLLLQLFVTPATQFRNDFLRRERGFSAARISLYTVLTVLPGAIGIVVGGRLADTRGRRRVGVVAVLGAAVGGTGAYWLSGWGMWVLSAVASLTGAAVIPALSVYGPELFGTEQRGAANGVLTAAGRAGSIAGLVLAGTVSQRVGRFAPAFALLASGPVVLALLIIVAFPETAQRSLEDLNPAATDTPSWEQ